MSHRFITRRPDANHKEIVDALQKMGITVADLSNMGNGICDIATDYRNKTVFMEIKFGKSAELKKTQVRFLANWSGYCGIARSIEDAVNLAKHPETYALTNTQKDRLGTLYEQMEGSKIHLETVMKMLNA